MPRSRDFRGIGLKIAVRNGAYSSVGRATDFWSVGRRFEINWAQVVERSLNFYAQCGKT